MSGTEPIGSIDFTALLIAAEACEVGDCLLFDTVEGYWRVATAAHRASSNVGTQAIARSEYGGAEVGKVKYQTAGTVPQSVTGLAVLTPSADLKLVRASTTGRLERIDAYTSGDDIVGMATWDGRMALNIGWGLISGTVGAPGADGEDGAPGADGISGIPTIVYFDTTTAVANQVIFTTADIPPNSTTKLDFTVYLKKDGAEAGGVAELAGVFLRNGTDPPVRVDIVCPCADEPTNPVQYALLGATLDGLTANLAINGNAVDVRVSPESAELLHWGVACSPRPAEFAG